MIIHRKYDIRLLYVSNEPLLAIGRLLLELAGGMLPLFA
jgi:hypothetical protein